MNLQLLLSLSALAALTFLSSRLMSDKKELKARLAARYQQKDDTLVAYQNKYVVYYKNEMLGIYDTYLEACAYAAKSCEPGSFKIKNV